MKGGLQSSDGDLAAAGLPNAFGSGPLTRPAAPASATPAKRPKVSLTSAKGPSRASLLGGCSRVDRFKKLNRIDEGTYGVVFRARDTETEEVVALKQLKLLAAKSEDGFPVSSLREISLLLKLDHPNIIRCREVVVGNSQQHIFMVMDYAEHELKVVIDRHRFSIAERKCLLRQLLHGVRYLHESWVLHRDLKTTNILLTTGCVLKICDFGLARHFGEPARPYTSRVQSLWYRAPELLMNQRGYTEGVDVWSVGCVFAEMVLRRPVFQGRAELHQLSLIYELTGVPSEETWPGYDSLPGRRAAEFKLSLPRWRAVFPEPPEGTLSDAGLELMRSLLECCPARRVSAAGACEDPYFWEKPLAQEVDMMPTFQESNCEGRALPRAPLRGGPQAVAKLDMEALHASADEPVLTRA